MIEQGKIFPGEKDTNGDCWTCYWWDVPNHSCNPLKNGVEFHRCERCGLCSDYILLDDRQAQIILDDHDHLSEEDKPIRKTTFNRWRWKKI